MRRADLVTGLVFVALGAATLFESWRMPTFVEFSASPYSAPGIVPGMLGVALAVLGALIAVRATTAGPAPASAEARLVRSAPADGEPAGLDAAPRVGAAFALCMLYAGFLVGRIPFWLATFLFILAFILTFELWDQAGRARWRRQTAMALGVSALVALAVTYVFQEIFLVRLP